MPTINKQLGFTLIEVVMAIVIIGVALSGTLLTFNITVRHSADPILTQQATMIAQAYLEEILSKDFDPGTPSGGRETYTSIHNYNNLTDIGARDQTDTAIAGLENYTVNVNINTSSSLGNLIANTDVLRIDVTVSNSTHIPNITISSYRANF